jgi:hypothetical protein
MTTSSSLIVQIQIAIVGVIIVMGVFFIWRAVSSIDDRVKKLEKTVSSGGSQSQHASGWSKRSDDHDYSTMTNIGTDQDAFEEANLYAAEQMRQVFKDMAFPAGAVIITSDVNGEGDVSESDDEEVTSKLKIEEIVSESLVSAAPPVAPEVVFDESHSEADTDIGNPLSKTKLKAMKPEKLKDICRERGLPVEGTKAVLIDRIIGVSRD